MSKKACGKCDDDLAKLCGTVKVELGRIDNYCPHCKRMSAARSAVVGAQFAFHQIEQIVAGKVQCEIAAKLAAEGREDEVEIQLHDKAISELNFVLAYVRGQQNGLTTMCKKW